VVELTLHRYAQEQSTSRRNGADSKVIGDALGQNFEPKVKLATAMGLLSEELAHSISYLHGFRNTAHHRGLRHEGVLHSLSIFYLKGACVVLGSHSRLGWSSSSEDIISHRALKYLGSTSPRADHFGPKVSGSLAPARRGC
jgi:hypothetical protein